MTQHLRLVGLWFVLLAAVACQLQHDNTSPDTMETQTQSIIGGAVDTRYPAIGVLMVNKSGQFCTGTLVTPTFILTAAHCISAASNYVKQGSKIFFRIDLPSGGTTKAQYHEAKSLLSHPQYGKTGGIALVNDLGGVVLKAPVSNVQPFPIHFRPVLDGTIVNKQITFLGYGLIGTRPSKKTTKVKHGVQLTLRRLLNDRFEVQDTGKSICSGDSGGPALYQIAGKLRVIGVNSYVTGPSNAGQSYCEGSGFDFRTDVYGDWLQPILNTHGYTCSDNNDCGGCFQCAAGKCVPKVSAPHPSICKPCTSPADCGGNGNICVRTKQGNRCMQACDSLGCCPSSYSCTTVSASTKQCTPTSTVCPPVACQTDAQCGPGEECFQKICRPKVVTPSPQLCQKCASDADCGTGKCYQYVEGKYCTQPCLADNFCPGGYKCEFVSGLGRQCVPLDGHCKCKDDTICHTGYTCISGSCRVLGGGKYGHACNRKYHICGRNHGCLNHDKGTSSYDLCYAVCSASTPYPPGTPGSACRTNRYCDQETTCVRISSTGLACLRFCQNDEDCTNGGRCITQNGQNLCLCTKDSDCGKVGYGCNKAMLKNVGVCAGKIPTTPYSCGANFDCKQIDTGFRICLPKANTQKAGEPCDASRTCAAGLLCLNSTAGGSFCFPDCTKAGTCVGGGQCVTAGASKACICNNQSRCDVGYVCKVSVGTLGVCEKGTACTQHTQCPKSLVCVKGQCKEGCIEDKECPFLHLCKENQCTKVERPEPPKPEPTSEPAPVEPVVSEPAADAGPVVDVQVGDAREPVTKDTAGQEQTSEQPAAEKPSDSAPELSVQPPPQTCGCDVSLEQRPLIPLSWALLLLVFVLRRRP